MAAQLLAELPGIDIPPWHTIDVQHKAPPWEKDKKKGDAEPQSPVINEVQPIEARADALITFLGEDGKATLAIIIEVQLSFDEDKPYAWPMYMVNVRYRKRCDTYCLVVCVDEATAKWARKPIRLNKDWSLTVPVLGPEGVPAVTDPAEGKAQAVLSVLTSRGIQVTDKITARIAGCTDLDQLNTWLDRAITADSADELFDT